MSDPIPPIFVAPMVPEPQETRAPVGDAQNNEYLLSQIIDLGARVTALEKLLEGKLEHAVTRQEVFGAFADKVLERNREQRRTPA